MENELIEQNARILSGHGWSWLWLVLVVITAALLLVQAYRWLITPVPRRVTVGLVALRFTWVALLLWCLWDPLREESRTYLQGEMPDVLVAVDTSQSMSMPTTNHASAWPGFVRLARDIEENLPDELAGNVMWQTIGEKSEKWLNNAPAEAAAKFSPIFPQLRDAAALHPGTRSSMVVFLISDGQDTSSIPAVQLGRELRQLGAAVYPVLPDDPPQPVEFARLGGIRTPASVVANEQFPLRVRWNCRLHRPTTFDLTITDSLTGELLASQELSMDGPSQGEEVFQMRAEEAGLKNLRVMLMPRDEKIQPDNLEASVAVVNHKETRVLLVQGSLDWEFRFVRKALASNPSIRMDALIRLNQHAMILQRENEEAIVQRGDAMHVLDNLVQQYNVVILANVNPDFVTERAQQNLLRLVRDDGGGVLFFSGHTAQSARFRHTLVEELLPVRLSEFTPKLATEDNFSRQFRNTVFQGVMNSNEQAFVRKHEQVVGTKFYDSLREMKLTDTGRTSPIWQTASDDGTMSAPTPPRTFAHFAQASAPKPAATVLAEHTDELTSAGQPRPLMAVQQAGRGRTAFLGVDALWRWRMSAPAEAREYDRFWQQLLLWLGQSAGGTNLESDRFEYQPGETAQVSFLATNPPQAGQSFMMRVITPSGQPEFVTPQTTDGGAKGVVNYHLQQPGSYQFHMLQLGQPIAAQTVQVQTREIEREHSGMNLAFLRELAQSTGGQILSRQELKLLPTLLSGTREEVRVADKESLWRMNWLFLLILGLYLAELGIRRKFLLT